MIKSECKSNESMGIRFRHQSMRIKAVQKNILRMEFSSGQYDCGGIIEFRDTDETLQVHLYCVDKKVKVNISYEK